MGIMAIVKKPVVLLFIIGLLYFASPFPAGAFGVSPPFVTNSRLVKGSRFETVIYLVQGQPTENLEVKAEFDLPVKIKNWLTIDKGESFIIPAGVQQFPIKVAVTVPKDADFGSYKGFLRINTVPKRAEGQQIAISVGARIDINFTVGENVVTDFNVRKINILDIREDDDPAVEVTIENTGNVPTAPERATFDLFDKYGEIRLGFAQAEDIPEIQPFETKTFTLTFPINIALSRGEYWGSVNLYRDGNSVKELRTIFNVLEKKKVNYILYAELGGGILILLVGVGWLLRRRKVA